jgi:hypothetical protein
MKTLKDHEPDDHSKTEDATMTAPIQMRRGWHQPEIQI